MGAARYAATDRRQVRLRLRDLRRLHTFADFPLVTIGEAPVIETHIIPSDAEPSGMGEPPYPSVAPAIVNAIDAASGRGVRRLPLEAQ